MGLTLLHEESGEFPHYFGVRVLVFGSEQVRRINSPLRRDALRLVKPR